MIMNNRKFYNSHQQIYHENFKFHLKLYWICNLDEKFQELLIAVSILNLIILSVISSLDDLEDMVFTPHN